MDRIAKEGRLITFDRMTHKLQRPADDQQCKRPTPLEEKQRALHEIRACAQAHLWRVLEPSSPVRGLWHRLLRRIVVRRMDSMLDGLMAELEVRDGAVADRAVFPSQTQRAEA